MTLLIASILAAALSPAWGQPAAAPEEAEWDARFTNVTGEVYVRSAGEEDWRKAEAQVPLQKGDEVQTGPSAAAEIALDGENVVELGADSQMTVGALEKQSSTVELTMGSLIAKLASLLGQREFKVKTPSAVAAVRGTEFGVEVDEEETSVGVFDEGKVSVRRSDAQEEVLLEPGREVGVRRGQALRARALERFARRRAGMQRLRARLVSVRRAWRKLPPEKRRELRQRFMRKRALRREEFLKRRQKWIEKRMKRKGKR